jgi:hypothetical protein
MHDLHLRLRRYENEKNTTHIRLFQIAKFKLEFTNCKTNILKIRQSVSVGLTINLTQKDASCRNVFDLYLSIHTVNEIKFHVILSILGLRYPLRHVYTFAQKAAS